jgi:DNA-binding MarR family transcriptional regulator
MRPNDLAARSVERAAVNDRLVLAAVLEAGELGIRPGGELAARAGLPERTVREVLFRLEARRLVRREGKRRVWATDAGRSEAGAEAPRLSLAPTLDAALACLPAEALRAFTRLTLSAIPARWHLASRYPTGWGGFIALGPTKTGKTSIAALACRVYGIDALAAIKVAQYESPGSLFARRLREGPGFRVERSPLLGLPFVCVDEWDKASRDLRAAAGGLLLGNATAELEGERLVIRPTVYVTLNTGHAGLAVLQEAYVRRSVVLDTSPLAHLLVDIDEGMARLFGGQVAIPHLHLTHVRPPAPALPGEVRAMLRAELRNGLNDDGWAHVDVEALARISLGRGALTGGELEQAALATATDYLSCAATIGHAKPEAAARLASRLLDDGALAPDPASEQAEFERRRKLAADRQLAAERARLKFVDARSRAAATTIKARDAMGRTRDVERQSIAAALTEAAERIKSSRGPEALRRAWQAASPHIEQAQRWIAARDAADAAKKRAAEQARHQRDLERAVRAPRRRADPNSQPVRRPRRHGPLSPPDDPPPPTLAAALESMRRRAARVSPAATAGRTLVGKCPKCGRVSYMYAFNGRCGHCNLPLVPTSCP